MAPFADVIVMGESEDLLKSMVDACFGGLTKQQTLAELSQLPGFFVPSHHGDAMPAVAQCNDTHLPAHSAIFTEEAVLSNMFLLESERGCSRACSFCVMRRSTNGGMRLVAPQKIIETIPDQAKRVGLVGAAVSDHPKLVDIVRQIVDGGKEIGLASLRADRLSPELVELLIRGGYRTLTVASDGASENLRIALLKKIRAKHLLRAAELAGEFRMQQLKVYMMIGSPGETDADIDELIDFSRQQAEICGKHTKVVLGIAPFVAKRNTPLDGEGFVGIREAERRIHKIKLALAPRIDVRPTSSRWAWVEYQMAQGGSDAGLAALEAWQQGGRFAHFKRAFASRQATSSPKRLAII
ncbi:MAG: radical SAM protein [Myxococcota bacterium]